MTMNEKTEKSTSSSILDRRITQVFLGLLILGLLLGLVSTIKFEPSLSHMSTSMLSGSTQGNYYAVVDRLVSKAVEHRGSLENISSKGSLDNIAKLDASEDSCEYSFALSQNGIGWSDDSQIEVIAHLLSSEVVFFLGPEADTISGFADLEGLRIGVGPSGSGTAQVAEEIFASRGFSALGIKVSHQPISEQLDMLKRGDLDLGVFVIHPDSDFIGRAIHEYGMQIAHFPEAEALAYWTPSLRAGVLNAGRYDPVAMVPSTDKTVLEVDTLVLANGCPGRSDVVGLLILLNDAFPGLIEHNLAAVKTSDHSLHEAASEFYQNNGPTLMDDHVPWLADYVPGSGLVQISLIISVLFNFMGLGNRFRLWRIDARRIALEQRISNLFTGGVRFADLAHIEPAEDQKTPEVRAEIEALIQAFEDLAATSNAQSQETILGPDMGQEIGYRFQESMMEERVHALREYLKKL